MEVVSHITTTTADRKIHKGLNMTVMNVNQKNRDKIFPHCRLIQLYIYIDNESCFSHNTTADQ